MKTIIIIVAMLTCFVFIYGFFIADFSTQHQSNIGIPSTVNVVDVPFFDLKEDEWGRMSYTDQGVDQAVMNNDRQVRRLQFSPSGKLVGFLNNKPGQEDWSGSDVVLSIMHIATRDIAQIYEGSHRTAGWEWFSDDEILVYYSCGTECQSQYLINVHSGMQNLIGLGVGHEWSPNKEFVLAYNYSGGISIYGIIIGDKTGQEIFRLRRPFNGELGWSTQAEWSLDSSKVAVVIKKENTDALELLVFDVEKDFQQIMQADVSVADEFNIEWDNTSTKVQLNKNSQVFEIDEGA